MNVAVIPARGGSKRIPKKNIKSFAGKPLIAYSILAALESKLFDRVVVSTDSEEIAATSVTWGAEAPFLRPEELSDDMAGTDSVLLHAIEWLELHGGTPDYLCCIYATAAFVQAQYLRQGFELLVQNQATTAFSVATYPYPIFRSLKINTAGRLEMFWPRHLKSRSQDLPEAYHDAGQFYWLAVKKYKREGKLFSEDAIPVVLPRWLVQDIDTEEDFVRAELMYRSLAEAGAME